MGSIEQIVQCIYDIAAHPDCQRPIRDEIHATLRNNGGVLTLESLPLLSKLDSIMKESLRLRPGTMGKPYTVTILQASFGSQNRRCSGVIVQ